MTVTQDRSSDELARRYPEAFLTFMYTLRRRRGVPPALFYSYWRDTHCQISARLPGQHSLWIHMLDYERGGVWPEIAGVGRELAEEDRFDGVPEPVFLTEADLAEFAEAMTPLMNDEVNIFEETIGYRALGTNSRTFVDRLPTPAPDLDEPVLRLLVFCKQRTELDLETFRGFMRERLAPMWAAAEPVLKLRLHLFEPYVNTDLIMDARDLSHYKAPEKQYQACFEIVFADGMQMRRFATSDAWLGDEQRAHMREQHSFLVAHRHCMRFNGQMTLTGLRTVAVVQQIYAVGALNQTSPEVIELLGGYGARDV